MWHVASTMGVWPLTHWHLVWHFAVTTSLPVSSAVIILWVLELATWALALARKVMV